MLSLEDIQSQCKTTEKTVKIKAWGGDVKIRQLTVKESSDVLTSQLAQDGAMAMIKTASFALLEPKMSIDKIQDLSQEAFEGIREVVEAVGELSEVKK